MKFEVRFRPGDDVRALWLLVFCVLAGGAFYVQTRYQTAIAASHESAEMLYRGTVANVRIIREASGLRAVQSRAQVDLARISHDSSLSGTTASMLAMLHACAKRFDAGILEVRPGDTQAKGRDSLEETPLTIRVRGKFRDILVFIEDLSHHRTLIRISDTELTVANDGDSGAAEPRLDATIHAVMYRLTMPHDKDAPSAAAG